MWNVSMLGPLGIDRNRGSELCNTYESDTYFALQMQETPSSGVSTFTTKLDLPLTQLLDSSITQIQQC